MNLGTPISSITVHIPAGRGCHINLPTDGHTPASATLTNGPISINVDDSNHRSHELEVALPGQVTARVHAERGIPTCRFKPEQQVRVLYEAGFGKMIRATTPVIYWRGSIRDAYYKTPVPNNYSGECSACNVYFCSKECIDCYEEQK